MTQLAPPSVRLLVCGNADRGDDGAALSAVATLLPVAGAAPSADTPRVDYEIEPDPASLLAAVLPSIVDFMMLRALLEQAASEHGARMTAMRNASKNAGELIEQLNLQLNRTRQAEITQEILEVVAGADALT